MKIEINHNQLSDIYNIFYKVFDPIDKFVSKKQFLSITNNMQVNKHSFFPIPIYFCIDRISKNTKKLDVYFKKNFICNLSINDIYTFSIPERLKLGYKLFDTKDISHPGFVKFLNSDKFFIDCFINNFSRKKNLIQFTEPKHLKKIIKGKPIVGFHTRNVPHKAHEWIHRFGIKKVKNLLIQPLIGQYRAGEYKEDVIIKSNKIIVDEIYKNKNVYLAYLNTFPRYAGPREAIFHAIIRKNYGCSHFLVGRDHAGVKNYYNIYDSQKICKKYATRIGIKILTFNEPFLCSGCNIIYNKKCLKCNHNTKIKISGTIIRNLILNNKNVPRNIMRKRISKTLNHKSIIK